MRNTIEPTFGDRVYTALSDNPASTCQELARICGLTPIQTGKQLTELLSRGKAVAMGKRACTITGRWMTFWRRVA